MTEERRWREGALDGAVAGGFLLVGWLTTATETTAEPPFAYTERDGLFVVLLALATLPYARRRRRPLTAFLVGLLATTALWVLGYDGGALPLLVVMTGAYWVASARPVAAVRVGAACALGCFTLLLVVDGAPFGWLEWVASVVSVVGAMALGHASRLRGVLAEARAEAAHEAALRRSSEERLRISAELHDIVGHSLAIIAVQAGVERHLMSTDDTRAATALDTIATISRDSLDELRAVVAGLRSDRGGTLSPAPGLADLIGLVATVRSTGLAVSLTLPAAADGTPRAVGAAIYRITQEALTNVVRHADASRAEVDVSRSADEVKVSVHDNGRARAGTGRHHQPGHGIDGMRERTEAHGGTFRAGTDARGGFLVTARFPVGPD